MKKFLLSSLLAVAITNFAAAAEFHVATSGNDANDGSPGKPLRTIQAAAEKAQAGDTITVHAGIYRERVNPPRGGESDANRITYQAAPDEKVVITGAAPMKGWTKVSGDTWKVVIPKASFGDFNPFADRVQGEWCGRIFPRPGHSKDDWVGGTGRHSGSVYLNGHWLTEAFDLESLVKPAAKPPSWFAKVEDASTTVWAQFPGVNPNEANVEISVRQCVFYPSKPGINYITVRGFELRQAATPWAGAMSEQVGLIGTHWSKGWIIENNDIHHSMCTGVTLGRYELPKNEFPAATAPGFVKSIELALRDGWSKETVGSHIVRNNHISHCEKNAIHGSLGSPFCEISGNDIHDIARTGWVFGADTGGIKFLGGVDMVIRDNHIHHCGGAAGIWLDWMAQGAVVTGNLLHDNGQDIFFEMQHGPLVSANNILLSRKSQLINSEGLALVHNLIAGATRNISDPRATPFHPAHALTIAGLFTACAGDHRLYNNIFEGDWNILGQLPNVASGNVFTGTAKPLSFDSAPTVKPAFNLQCKIIQKADGWYLTLNADPAWRSAAKCKLITTELLGMAKASGCAYENPDGTPLRIDTDYFGKKRDASNPFPGAFEISKSGTQTIKVWPKERMNKRIP